MQGVGREIGEDLRYRALITHDPGQVLLELELERNALAAKSRLRSSTSARANALRSSGARCMAVGLAVKREMGSRSSMRRIRRSVSRVSVSTLSSERSGLPWLSRSGYKADVAQLRTLLVRGVGDEPWLDGSAWRSFSRASARLAVRSDAVRSRSSASWRW